MITPTLTLTIGEPPPPRFATQPSNVAPFAILDNGEPVAWAASEALAKRIADFLNWRDALDASEHRYREAFLHA